MKLLFLLLFICLFSSVYCGNEVCSNKIILEPYQAYLIGFMFLFMFLTIVVLIILFYIVRNNKTIMGININKKLMFVRQESGQGLTTCSYGNTANELVRNDESTLTTNTGAAEVHGSAEPETPTRLEPRHEIKPTPLKKPITPIIQKAQMDDIIRGVLESKRQDRGSTTLRAIEASLNNLDVITKENTNEGLYGNLPLNETRKSPTNGFKNKLKNSEPTVSMKGEKSVVDGANKYETNIAGEDEQEVYDTLPNPVRCVDSTSDDDDLTNIPVYDSPPRRDWDNGECRSVVLDSDTDYMLLLTPPDKDDRANYINAKLRDSH